jgi:hypothetical protein
MENGSTFLVRTGRGLDNLKLTSIADLLPGSALYDLQEVSAGEIKPHVPSVPRTMYHVRVALESGTDRYLSFDAKLLSETDERSGSPVEYYDLYRLHLDGKPCTVADVDRLFDGGMERLEQWLFAQTEVRS